jgi:hypothetical protein
MCRDMIDRHRPQIPDHGPIEVGWCGLAPSGFARRIESIASVALTGVHGARSEGQSRPQTEDGDDVFVGRGCGGHDHL